MRADVARGQIEMIRVSNIHQIQAECWRSESSGLPTASFEHLLSPPLRSLSGADLHQNPCDIAHHVMQEGIGTDIQHDELPKTRQTQVVHTFDR